MAKEQVTIDQLQISGTPTNSTFLRGDNSWSAVPQDSVASLTDTSISGITTNDILMYQSGFWTNVAVANLLKYEVSHWVNGAPLANEIFMKVLFTQTVIFDNNFGSSLARCGISATNGYVVEILKNGINVGNITFSAGVTSGVFSASSISFGPGDQMALRAPASTDATFSDPVFAIQGTFFIA